jgi:hypothetical protein
MALFKLLRRFSFLSADATLSIDNRFGSTPRPSLWLPYPLGNARLSVEQNEVGRVDKEARERVLPGFARAEAMLMSESDETT